MLLLLKRNKFIDRRKNRRSYLSLICMMLIAISMFFQLLLSMGTSAAYMMSDTPSIRNMLIPSYDFSGTLTICKAIEHPFGEDYKIPEDIEFTFQVELGEFYAGKTLSTTSGDKVVDENGILTVTVGPNSEVEISEMEPGDEITITEIETENAGFIGKEESSVQKTVIQAECDTVVNFVSTYSPEGVDKVNVIVTGTKLLEGRDWKEGDSFTFNLEYRVPGASEEQWITAGDGTIIYDPSDSEFNQFDFTEYVQSIEYDSPGIYTFRIYEVKGSIEGIRYDDIINFFDVKVGDQDMDGRLEIQDVTAHSNSSVLQDEGDNAFIVEITFENEYVVAGSAEINIAIHKILEDKSGQNMSPAGFVFGLYDENGELVKESAATSSDGKTCITLVYDVGDAGKTFTYTLREVIGDQTIAGMSCDVEEHQIQISVVDNLDGTIKAEGDCEKTFYNIYDPEDAVLNIGGNSVLTNGGVERGVFDFELYETEDDFMIPEDTSAIQTVSNNENGEFWFAPLTFDKVGTYYYVVMQDASVPMENVMYDAAAYGVSITVMDNGNGQLLANCTINKLGGSQVEQITFENIYMPETNDQEKTELENGNTETISNT